MLLKKDIKEIETKFQQQENFEEKFIGDRIQEVMTKFEKRYETKVQNVEEAIIRMTVNSMMRFVDIEKFITKK